MSTARLTGDGLWDTWLKEKALFQRQCWVPRDTGHWRLCNGHTGKVIAGQVGGRGRVRIKVIVRG